MSSKRFKIILHLEHFFRDHRSTARIFINEKLHTIKDLCRHISNIFNIQNFYLTCENQYLPPSEDIEVLQPNENIWVRPQNFLEWQHESFVNKNVFNGDEKCEKNTLAIKKKRKKIEATNDADENFDDACEKKKKKKKFKREHEDDFSIISMFLQNKPEHDAITAPEVPKKRKTSKKGDNVQEISVQGSRISTSSISTRLETTLDSDTEQKKESKSISKKQEINKQNVTQNPKVNIIENKIIHITTDQIFEKRDNHVNGVVKFSENHSKFSIKQTSTPIMNNSNVRNDNKRAIPTNFSSIKNNIVNGLDSPTYKFSTEKSNNFDESTEKDTVSMIDESNSFLDNDDTTSTTSRTSFENRSKSIRPSMLKMSIGPFVELVKQKESNNIDDSFVTKRKRKRVRHRKGKTVSETKKDIQQSCEENTESTPVFVPVYKPQMHIRFSDDDGDATKKSVINKFDVSNTEINQQNSQTNINHKSDINETQKNRQHNQISIDFNSSEALSDEQIKNCAEITFPPKTGNVIAFKILRISEMYTPEISTFIIAKVLDAKEQNQEVTLEIIRGKEQFAEPEGKFSLEELSVEGESKEEEKVNNVAINWPNLLDVRLLTN